MSKAKKIKATDTEAAIPQTTKEAAASIVNPTWTGLRDTGMALMQGAATQKALGSQSLAAATMAFLAEKPVTVKVGDAEIVGDFDMLATYFDVIVLGSKGEEKDTLRKFKATVIDGMMKNSKPERPTNATTGKAVNSVSFQMEMKTWQSQRATFSAPFDLACALVKRGYDAGDFLIGHGFNILRQDIVPRSFSLVTGNVHRPQSPDDTICLNFASIVHRGKMRDDQVTLIEDKDGQAFVNHSVADFLRAQKPVKDVSKKGLNLIEALEYIAKIKDSPKVDANHMNTLQEAIAVLSRIAEFNKASIELVDVNETDGKGNVKAA